MFYSANAPLALSLLQVQYRMHPCLSEFPSNTFYEGALQNGVTEAERTNPAVAFPWPDASRCLMFYQQRGMPPSHELHGIFVTFQQLSQCSRNSCQLQLSLTEKESY
jgi:superfamily I DNA and/or RNA helicase